jgi:uncharacterized protein involved in cysteine biosynthesis
MINFILTGFNSMIDSIVNFINKYGEMLDFIPVWLIISINILVTVYLLYSATSYYYSENISKKNDKQCHKLNDGSES